ncbi:ribonucleoside-diphosphate reductase, alpha chain [Candidatus Kaiserbacteria bacterium RIFCSPLOWO2_02_FULL_45_11b]|uniref:Ribonucleoside-diphosphate reductase n=1 Tax=Candidatus Kaiserbacteria bacterium RIFCSPLOWO2_12_FULL_45_26 TaxID=1798525 RepID=A0A1F6FF96_9BACT|nr:MAG: ribonucleoside-diphosphate reductase, alpha chain [Candidatus Kaiserbacteria bacterium RIFCSPHIGHO2_12_45_16]OGG70268.1 MAG: ribonucleoside-diphosphate reductase, alpha chain [Candidatus Kaiserbacteria bacterium RIFCSPLOWO2_01_FULL_45_25]OGG81936.1 MAG: ribonucleoside-diphosphate reductase, alpha chain [Candidatus Kaiserbacteria bacterium RIFCSPLOWO2_02_FULL_45_11b]OGG84532.1 MAG: ribonucleoside-diphosphate reductase, alpha chain [Candidatus Kaiserbacteria bacterium RIFCSPLOWO2_12_FULL_4
MESWYWLNENSRGFLDRGYLAPGQTPEERIRVIAETAEKYLGRKGFADKFYEYMGKGWISLASPVWSNFGIKKGLPISCFGSYVDDHMGSILYTNAEVGMMSKFGGGCSGYFGAVRPRGADISDNGHSSGSVHFMQLFETLVDVVSQGSVRRGHFSPYLPVEHPDIMEFLDIGTEGNPIQKLTHAVTVGDKWMEEMIGGDEVKRAIWARVIQRRGEMGYPYILFKDTANKNTVDVYKDKGLTIYASNMCSEIMLPSREDWSFVCCLSSLNLMHYEDWKDTDLVETMIAFLDAVMEDFIVKLEELRDHEDPERRRSFSFMERAYNFAKANRALGLGVLGWHSLLQSRGLAFESSEAETLNVEVFKTIKTQADEATKKLATELGEPEILKGYGRRNTTLLAIAPTTSSAFILGQVSQGIEPIWSNCYVKDVAKMKVTIKNPTLLKLLSEKGKDTKEVWDSIRDADGSVQHLDFLTDQERAIYRTFAEIDQAVVIKQAADRQPHIDQGQSLNIMVEPATPVKDINQLYINAWKQGVKSLYYQHSMNAAQQMVRKKLASNAKEMKENNG